MTRSMWAIPHRVLEFPRPYDRTGLMIQMERAMAEKLGPDPRRVRVIVNRELEHTEFYWEMGDGRDEGQGFEIISRFG